MKKFLSVAVLFLGMSTAHAGFLLDPYFNYVASGSADFASGASVTGTELGARLGWDFMGLGVGADVLASGKYTYSLNGTTADSTPSYYGVFVSYKFPIIIRAYAAYLLSNKENISGGDFKGSGMKLGVQYTGLPFVAIGLEYFSSSYDKIEAGGVSVSQTNKASHTAVAISFPFVL